MVKPTPIITPVAPQATVAQPSGSFGVEALNSGLGQMARGVHTVAAQVEQHNQENDQIWVAQKMAEARSKWTQHQIDREAAIEGDGAGYAKSFSDDFATYMEEVSAQAPSDMAADKLEVGLTAMGGRFTASAMAYEAATRVEHRAHMIGQTIDAELNNVVSDPAQAASVRANLKALLENSGLPGKVKRDFIAQTDERLAIAEVQGLINVDPVGTMNELNKGRWDKYLTPEKKQQLLNLTKPAAGRSMAQQFWNTAAVDVGPMLASDDPNQIADALMPTLIGRESAGDPTAESPKGAAGLAQIMPDTAREIAASMGMRDVSRLDNMEIKQWLKNNPEKNAEMGKFYLVQQLEKYDNNIILALAAYNAGPGAVDKWLDSIGDPRNGDISSEKWAAMIPYKETREYVAWITSNVGKGGAKAAGEAIPDETVRRSFDAEIANLKAEDNAAQAEYLVGFEDYIGFLQQGKGSVGDTAIYTRDQLMEELGPIKGQQAFDMALRAGFEGQLFKSLRTAPPWYIENARKDLELRTEKPEGFVDNAQALATFDKIVADRNKQIAKDPAAYVISSSDRIREAAEGMNDDPEKYARLVIAAQTGLGVPTQHQRVLTKSQSEQIVGDISSTPSEEVGQKILQMANLWGDNWGSVLRDLRNSDMQDGDYIAASYAQDHPALAQQIVASSRAGKELEDGLERTVVNDMKLALNAELTDYQRAFAAGAVPGEATEDFNKLRGAMQQWVMGQMNAGVDPAVAVDDAVGKFLQSKFLDPIEDSRVHALVPSTFNGEPLNERQVDRAIDAVMNEDTINRFKPMIMGPGGLVAYDNTVATALNSGRWVGNDENDGIMLMVPTREGVMLPLLNEKAEPFELLYQDIVRLDGDLSIGENIKAFGPLLLGPFAPLGALGLRMGAGDDG